MKRITDFETVDFFVPDDVILPDGGDKYLIDCGFRNKTGTMHGKHGVMWIDIPSYLVTQWLEIAHSNQLRQMQ